MADTSLRAIMDTVEPEGAFIPDDWISMFGLLTDELSFRDYGDLILEIFEPFVGWMESRPPAATNATTPTLTTSVESIEPSPLFLPSPGIPTTNINTPKTLKRARPVSPSTAEVQSSKRLRAGDENTRPSPDDACKDVPSLKVVPATPITMKTGSDQVTQDALGPAIALTPAVWRVSFSSPLAPQTPRFSSPNGYVSLSDPVPASSRTPTPSSERMKRKPVSSSKFTPSKNSGSSTVFPVDKSVDVTCGKLESSKKSVVTGKPDKMCKTVPKFVPFRTSVSPNKSVSSSKSVASSSESVSSSQSTSSSKFVSSTKSASSSKSSISSGKSDASSSKSASSSAGKPVAPEKFVPTRKSRSSLSNVPRTPQQPNGLNLQRRLIIISPPSRPSKSTHRI
ncbi:hypothetical protein C0995_008485 [Termitomyces sp. Mi166|nr:hypothetical protein C0995_008485 [Termitomyces sp. Mi166\